GAAEFPDKVVLSRSPARPRALAERRRHRSGTAGAPPLADPGAHRAASTHDEPLPGADRAKADGSRSEWQAQSARAWTDGQATGQGPRAQALGAARARTPAIPRRGVRPR